VVAQRSAFWDSSALVPLFLNEPASRIANRYLRRYTPVVWWASPVEIASAIERSLRSGSIDPGEARQAVTSLNRLRTGWQEVSPDDAVRDLACRAVEKYPLRAADALQLAAAMLWCQQRPAGRAFLCSDRRLSEAAKTAGFSIVEI
jgi:hypothetical protein